MVKKDLLNFVDRVEVKAVRTVEDRYNKLIDEKKDEVLNKYKDKMEVIQSNINRQFTNLTELLTDLKEDKEIAFSGSRDIRYGIKYLEGNNILREVKKNSDFLVEVEKLRIERNKEVDAVKTNYLKVRLTCKSMSSAKKIAEYLEGVGFDISSIKQDEIKALTTDLDKTKLFVCGENH